MKPVVALSSLLGLGLLSLCSAQSVPEPKPQFLSILVTKIKPDMARDWEAVVKNETGPALKKAGVPWRGVWQTAVFGDLNEYVTVTPIEKFAQYDGPSPFARALGEEGSKRLLAKISKLVVDQHRYAIVTRPDLSLQKQMEGPPTLAVVNSVKVAPGKAQEYENYLKNDLLPAWKKTEIENFLVHQTVFGGDSNEWVILVLLKNFAVIDAGHPLTKALGQEAADQLRRKAAGLVTSSQIEISRYRQDLSYGPAPSAKPSGGAGK